MTTRTGLLAGALGLSLLAGACSAGVETVAVSDLEVVAAPADVASAVADAAPVSDPSVAAPDEPAITDLPTGPPVDDAPADPPVADDPPVPADSTEPPADDDCPEASYITAISDCAPIDNNGGFNLELDVEPELESDPTGGNQISAFALDVGDCGMLPDTESLVFSLEGKDCDEPHEFEVVHEFSLPSGPFPGEDEIFDTSIDVCVEGLETYAATTYESSIYDVFALYPTAESWANGDRVFTCLGISYYGDPLVGSMKDTGL